MRVEESRNSAVRNQPRLLVVLISSFKIQASSFQLQASQASSFSSFKLLKLQASSVRVL
jgi:hypothetical protein